MIFKKHVRACSPFLLYTIHFVTLFNTRLIQLPSHCLDAAAEGRAVLNEFIHAVNSEAVFAQLHTFCSITPWTLSPAPLHHFSSMTDTSIGVCKPNPRGEFTKRGLAPLKSLVAFPGTLAGSKAHSREQIRATAKPVSAANHPSAGVYGHAFIIHGSVHICGEGQNKGGVCAMLLGLMNEPGMVWLSFLGWDGLGTALGRPRWPSLLMEWGSGCKPYTWLCPGVKSCGLFPESQHYSSLFSVIWFVFD